MTALPLILPTHVEFDSTLDMLDLAFARLGGFLDVEAATLEALGEALSLPRVGQSLGALHLLHRGGRDTDPQVIETAIGHLADLRDQLLAVPHGASVVMPQALHGAVAPKEVDAAIRFMAARLDDQIAALLYALGEA
jgi:hypothetical protein